MKKNLLLFFLFLRVLSGWATDNTDFDFCESNSDGKMLYYRYVEQFYCELVAGPEKYTGIVTIPSYVTEHKIPVIGVGFKAFDHCDGLTEVHLPFTMLYLQAASFYWCKDLQKVVLNENLIAIGQLAFEGCQELTSINIPQSLEYMGYEALYGCFKMTTPLYNDKHFFYYPMLNYESEGKTYVIPEGIEVIGEGAFIFTFLHEVVIPNSVKTISDYAFDGSQIRRVNIPASVESIGDKAFGQTFLDEVVVPASVKNFGKEVFSTSWNLKRAVLENPLDSIPFATFSNCTKLQEVSYPASVHKLGDYSFCQTSLTCLPDLSNIDTLGISVFYGCKALESVSLPASITYIPDDAFNMCLGVKEVHLPESIESIGDYAFWQIPLLENITIPASVKSIGNYAFAFCENLRNIDLSEGLITIGEEAFSQLKQLESISLPKSIKSIGSDAFAYGFKLKDVYVQWQEPLELQDDIFDSYQGMALHVPVGTAEQYANAEYWSNFNNIIEDVTAIEEIKLDNKPIRDLKPIKRIINGKVIIESKSGKVLVDGKKVF